jgi:mRNA interferase RelE/StbE
MYVIRFRREAERELRALDDPMLARVGRVLSMLKIDPRAHGSRKLTGQEDLWRMRAGVYRIVYAIDDPNRTVTIVRIRHRKDVYRSL